MDESYSLSIPSDGSAARLRAKTLFGAYHGLESLSQLVRFNSSREGFEIHGAPWAIEDAPRYPVGREGGVGRSTAGC